MLHPLPGPERPFPAGILPERFNATPGRRGPGACREQRQRFRRLAARAGHADRTGDCLRPLPACGVLALALTGLLASATSLPVAVVGLIALGGPTGVGSSLLFAHLKHSGARPSDIVNTRAIVSVAWVAGAPLATFIMGTLTGWLARRAQRGDTAPVAADDPAGNDAVPARR